LCVGQLANSLKIDKQGTQIEKGDNQTSPD